MPSGTTRTVGDKGLVWYGRTATPDRYFDPTRGTKMSHIFTFPPLNPKNGSKRPRIVSPEMLNTENRTYTKYFVIKMNEGSFKTVSPFIIHKALTSTVGELDNVKKLNDGSLLIEVKNEKQSDLISKLIKLHTYEVFTEPHRSLNVTKGVITCQDLLNCNEAEILDNLKEYGVIGVRRITTKKNGEISPTASLILSFETHSLPERIKAGFHSLRVRPYIPNPLRCFKCQKFGHISAKCEFESACPSCGKPDHPNEECSPPPICANCNGNHSPRYKGCPVYKAELEIQRIKTTEKLSYFEARKKYKVINPQGILYSSALTNTRKYTINPLQANSNEKISDKANIPNPIPSQNPNTTPQTTQNNPKNPKIPLPNLKPVLSTPKLLIKTPTNPVIPHIPPPPQNPNLSKEIDKTTAQNTDALEKTPKSSSRSRNKSKRDTSSSSKASSTTENMEIDLDIKDRGKNKK